MAFENRQINGRIRHRSIAVISSIVLSTAAVLLLISFRGGSSQSGISTTARDRYCVANRNRIDIDQSLIDLFSGENILQNLRNLTRRPHIAGTSNNRDVAEWIKRQWIEQGLQDVHFAEYQVLLSHPVAEGNRSNLVELLDENDQTLFKSEGVSPPIIPEEQNDPEARRTWNAYSASGDVQGGLVYVNYGSESDFDYLDKQNISIKNRVALIRYGKLWRGHKVKRAQERGAIAVVLFSDPLEVAPGVTSDPDNVYPKSIWMPQHGVQRGTLMNFDGDPLTPGYPALNYTYRTKTTDDLLREEIFPSIPVQPISYYDAERFLKHMGGPEAPSSWQGGLNLTYRLGPDFAESKAWKVRVMVEDEISVKTVNNVIAYIEGQHEPDRYVIIGNHFDAWTYGSIDPNSGTATMLEMSRVMMQTINETGWRPARTIVFCAWDAEEYSLIGSVEWMEEHRLLLDRRAVAYLNVDLISGNETLYAETSPLLYEAVVTAAKKVPNPDQSEIAAGRPTVFDTWIRKQPDQNNPDRPQMPAPGTASDHVTFYRYVGVPVVNFRYLNITLHSYPLYHTLYETQFLEANLQDPKNMSFHVAVGRFWAQIAHLVADSELLPFNGSDYAKALQYQIEDLRKAFLDAGLLEESPLIKTDLLDLTAALEKLDRRTEKFNVFSANPQRQCQRERFNSRLEQIERCFFNPRIGRHVIFGEDDTGAVSLPFIYEQLNFYKKTADKAKRLKVVGEIRNQISIVRYSVECAITLLKRNTVKNF